MSGDVSDCFDFRIYLKLGCGKLRIVLDVRKTEVGKKKKEAGLHHSV